MLFFAGPVLCRFANHKCLTEFKMHLCSCMYFMHCNKKNVKIKYTNTNLFKDLSGNTLAWNISLILTPYNSHNTKKRSFKIHWLTRNLFRLNIFAIYFPLKLIVFTVHIFSIRTFSLYQTKVIFAFMKRIDVDHFYHKCVIEYWLIG